MANAFWKLLGSKLLDAGAAYVQQVSVINELKQLSQQEGLERFARYVRALSSTARAGLAVTLATLASRERDASARHRIEEFLAYLRAGGNGAPVPALAQAPAPPARPTDAPDASDFDEDLNRVDAWSNLDQAERDHAVARHLASLDDDALSRFAANLKRMQANCDEHLQDHKTNEARIVAGRFVEDQIAYNNAVLATGQHDPGWLQRLRELERYAAYFGWLHRLTLAEAERRQAKPGGVSGDHGGVRRALQGLRQMLDEQLATGEIRSEREAGLRRLLDHLERAVAGSGAGADQLQRIEQIKSLLADAAPLLSDPGSAARLRRASPRARQIDAYAGQMKVALGRELMEAPPTPTANAIGAILGDLTSFQQRVASADDDPGLAQLESDVLRPAARARHELLMARHAMLAQPLWEGGEFLPQVNVIAFAGATDLQERLDRALAPRGLRLANDQRLQNHAQQRWRSLNSCHVAVFDLRGAGRIAELATSQPARARQLTAAAYELGLAFALGRPVVVVADQGERMPFDVDLDVVGLSGADEDLDVLLQAIDEAFYVPQRGGNSSSLAASVAFLDQLTVGHPKRTVFERLGWLDPAIVRDPAGFLACAEQIVRDLEPKTWRILRPAWPAAYPDLNIPRCFHVMPFGPAWANEARDSARAACKEAGFRYRRGDEAEEGLIIHAIWEDLCQAQVLLVDLTGGNLNVMIELGMAHAIGRPVISVQRTGSPDLRPRHIEKLRVHAYASGEELRTLLREKLALYRSTGRPQRPAG